MKRNRDCAVQIVVLPVQTHDEDQAHRGVVDQAHERFLRVQDCSGVMITAITAVSKTFDDYTHGDTHRHRYSLTLKGTCPFRGATSDR
jgi:hypothetical protein